MHLDFIGEILERILKSYTLFSVYILINKSMQKTSTPTKIVDYDFTFISERNGREVFIRIKDFYKHQNIILWIRNTKDEEANKVDVELYFLEKLKNNGIKQKLIFKSKSEAELENHLRSIFKYLTDNSDEQFKEIISGKRWIDTPFDWGDYK